MKPHLFHTVADPGSAAARRALVDWRLEDAVRLRNVFYPEVEADLKRFGGTTTPALWDGTRLIEGAEPVLAALQRLRQPREP